MIRLLYSSQARPGITEQDIAEILEQSRKNNLDSGITGVLLYGGELFMQVLEGPELAVLKKYIAFVMIAATVLIRLFISLTRKKEYLMIGLWAR